jgi:hypothetical protein
MADQKITELTEVTTVASTDILPVVVDPSTTPYTRKVTKSNLFANGVSATVAAAANAVGLTVTQNDTTNNPRGISVVNAGTANSLFIDTNGNSSTSTSTGGAVLIENTGNTGGALNIYTRNDAPTRLVKFDVQPAYNTLVDGIQTMSTSSESLTVDSTSGFPASGTLRVLNSTSTTENGKIIFIHYTSVDATHFIGTAGAFYKASTSLELVDNAIVYSMNTSNTFIETLIEDSSTQGGSVNLKIRGPNPDLEFHSLGGYYNDQGEGQYEIDIPMGDNVDRVSTDCIRINGRNDANNSFEPIIIFTRPGATRQGMVGIGFQNLTDPTTVAAHLHIKNDDADGDTGAAALVGLVVQGAESQTANLAEFKNDGGTTLSSVSAAGVADIPHLSITDGVTAPTNVAGKALIYVDTADGDLKVKFADGTVKTLAADT